MNTETLDQKINRLERTIQRCIHQINDKRNTDEVIDIFTKAKAEAERQLSDVQAFKTAGNAAQKGKKPHLCGENGNYGSKGNAANAAPRIIVEPDLSGGNGRSGPEENAVQHVSITPHLFGENEQSGSKNNAANMTPAVTIESHLSGESQNTTPHFPPAENTPPASVIYATGSGSTRLVRIEWVGGKKEAVTLTEGQIRSRFTSTLRDCAESQPAVRENWEKLVESQSFRNLVTYYRALALLPRPSGEEMATMEDIGRGCFLGRARVKLWELIQEDIDDSPATKCTSEGCR
jgi:hypothetical protein